jgi:predicted O-linked N-acetylglucosamine transferase (SPINDLY family)
VDPQSAEAWQSLGDILSRVGQTQAAEDALRKAVELDPVLSTARIRLADVLISQFRLNEAEDACRKGIELDPASAAPHATLAEIAAQRWDFAQADSHYRSALEQEPHNLRVLSHRLFQLNYAPATEPMEAVAAALDYGQAARRDIAPFSDWTCSREPRRRLRVGMVSGDFGRHPVGMFLKAPLRQVDRMGFELFGYSCNAIDDDVTAELKQSFSVWRNAAGLDDAELARRIRDDGIDILIDLSGHTEAGRLSVFAWRSAPVQATWLGYFATTGLREVDWKLGDPFVTPIGEEHHFVERIWRLPGCCYCFDPPSDAPGVGELPSANAGRVTYGCFNNLAKLNDSVVALWSRVLAADRDATLFLKAKQLSSKELALALAARFARHGIGADRLVLEGSARYADYLAAYGRVDIALDPFPYTGGTTTVEGLWMGVPVVTLKGDRYLAHQGESLLHAAGLPDWIALDPDDYVDKALRLAADRSRLAKLRAELRTQVSASSLCDAARFCRGLEDAWRGMWQTWCDA